MKRSDMVDIMKDAFRGCQSFKSDKAMFNYVLMKMEDQGMLPPHNGSTLPIHDSWDVDKTYKWEVEDET